MNIATNLFIASCWFVSTTIGLVAIAGCNPLPPEQRTRFDVQPNQPVRVDNQPGDLDRIIEAPP